MRFKYYLRGISLGILFTVIIMMIALHNHKNELLSDEEIIERAKQLGMVMSENNENLEDIKDTELSFGEETSVTEFIEADKNNSSTEISSTQKEDSQEQSTEKNDDKNDDKTSQEEPDYVIIKVEEGDVCRNISEALEDLGIVDNAEDFRTYMGKKGYASRIHAGEYKIPRESSFEEIAQILIKK